MVVFIIMANKFIFINLFVLHTNGKMVLFLYSLVALKRAFFGVALKRAVYFLCKSSQGNQGVFSSAVKSSSSSESDSSESVAVMTRGSTRSSIRWSVSQ